MKLRSLALAIALGSTPLLSAYAIENILKPDGKPQISMQKIDTVIGTGKYALSGKTVTVHYTGWIYDPLAPQKHGVKFDSSVDFQPFTFPLGARKVIKGWDQGVVGMRVGGKRTLIIPSELAYGSRAAGDKIPADSDLIFDIELLDVQ